MLALIEKIVHNRGRPFSTCVVLACDDAELGLKIVEKCFARRLVGYDFDPAAVQTARANAIRNGVHNAQFFSRREGDEVAWSVPNTLWVVREEDMENASTASQVGDAVLPLSM